MRIIFVAETHPIKIKKQFKDYYVITTSWSAGISIFPLLNNDTMRLFT